MKITSPQDLEEYDRLLASHERLRGALERIKYHTLTKMAKDVDNEVRSALAAIPAEFRGAR